MKNGNASKQSNYLDAFIKSENKRFRVRACGIIIKDETVLMVKNNVDDYYYSVGGAIHIGESVEEACLREVYEETGHHYQIDRLAFIHECFFENDNVLWHEIAFYFFMKDSINNQFNVSVGSFGAEEEKVWIPIKDFHKFKAYPEFFATELPTLSNNIKLITTYE